MADKSYFSSLSADKHEFILRKKYVLSTVDGKCGKKLPSVIVEKRLLDFCPCGISNKDTSIRFSIQLTLLYFVASVHQIW